MEMEIEIEIEIEMCVCVYVRLLPLGRGVPMASDMFGEGRAALGSLLVARGYLPSLASSSLPAALFITTRFCHRGRGGGRGDGG